MEIEIIDNCDRKLAQAEALLASLLANDNHTNLSSEILGNAIWLAEDLIVAVRKSLHK